MTEQQPIPGSRHDRGGRARGVAVLGRRLGLALFWLLVTFVTISGGLSIVAQVFWPLQDEAAPARAEAHCAAEIDGLKSELLERAGAAVRRGTPLRPALAEWDRRYHALERCGRLESARVDLGTLRDELEALLSRLHNAQAPLRKRIERALQAAQAREHALVDSMATVQGGS